jgi:hypothetical protein
MKISTSEDLPIPSHRRDLPSRASQGVCIRVMASASTPMTIPKQRVGFRGGSVAPCLAATSRMALLSTSTPTVLFGSDFVANNLARRVAAGTQVVATLVELCLSVVYLFVERRSFRPEDWKEGSYPADRWAYLIVSRHL